MEKKDQSTIGVIPPSKIAKILAKKGIDINDVAIYNNNTHISIKTPKEAAEIIQGLQIKNPNNTKIKKF